MKTKAMFLLCLFLGIGLSQVSAQYPDPPKNGSGNIFIEAEYGPWSAPVYCDGALSDIITCTNIVVKSTLHYVNGEVTWSSNRVETHEWTGLDGEVYKQEAAFDHLSYIKGYAITRSTLIGNKGHVITNEIKTDTNTWEIIDIKSNCH